MNRVLAFLSLQLRNKKVQTALVTAALAVAGVTQTDPLYENLLFTAVGLIAIMFPAIHSPETEARRKEEKAEKDSSEES